MFFSFFLTFLAFFCHNNSEKEIMFNIDDLVIHTREGLAKIISSTSMGDKEYFLVKVYRGSGETIYVPIDSAINIIRPIMNEEEADNLLFYMKNIKEEFNSNTKQRRDSFKKRLSSGNVRDIAYLTRQKYFYELANKDEITYKLGPMDVDMLQYAEDILFDEFALSYSIERNNVQIFINDKINRL